MIVNDPRIVQGWKALHFSEPSYDHILVKRSASIWKCKYFAFHSSSSSTEKLRLNAVQKGNVKESRMNEIYLEECKTGVSKP
jgi:hypothetical protein